MVPYEYTCISIKKSFIFFLVFKVFLPDWLSELFVFNFPRRIRMADRLALLRWRQNSVRNCTALYYAEPFIITIPSPRNDSNNVERGVKRQNSWFPKRKFKCPRFETIIFASCQLLYSEAFIPLFHYSYSFEPQREKTYLLNCAHTEHANQPAHPRSVIRVFVFCMRKLRFLVYPKCIQCRLIRLRECAVWSESSLGAHVRRSFPDVAVQLYTEIFCVLMTKIFLVSVFYPWETSSL